MEKGPWSVFSFVEAGADPVVSIWTCILHFTSSMGVLHKVFRERRSGRYLVHVQEKTRDGACASGRECEVTEGERLRG